jgi:hypothetical protein
MLLLIDADSALYRAGCANEERSYLCVNDGSVLAEFKYKKEADEFAEEYGCEIEKHKVVGPIGISLHNLRQCCASMFTLEHSGYEMYIGGEGNFRYEYFPEYKANRDEDSKPKHIAQMKKHLQGQYKAQLVHREEVDDRVSWRQMQCIEQGIDSCIVSIDKDLDNTPGKHFNYVKQEFYIISPEQADLNFARQLLSGDSTDGIPGIVGMGKTSAIKILPEYREDWLDVVKQEYYSRGYDDEYINKMGRCLHMRRKPEEIWSVEYV